jgi:hypothetical protein
MLCVGRDLENLVGDGRFTLLYALGGRQNLLPKAKPVSLRIYVISFLLFSILALQPSSRTCTRIDILWVIY